jgi:hypothetical protein
MSTVPPPPPTLPPVTATAPPPSTDAPKRSTEIKLVSHSMLFYWWPVWALAFLMALVTLISSQRMAIIPSGADVTYNAETNVAMLTFPKGTNPSQALQTASGISEGNRERKETYPAFRPRVTEKSWPGAIFIVGLILTIIITNVPLRGLWSFLVIILVVVIALLLALLDVWDAIFTLLGNLHIHINMAGYMTIGCVVFVIWAVATYIFDRRAYVIFTPGQIKVCEHIGAGVQAYSTMGVSLEKQRDDLFRHYIFGLGSGDLILKMPSGDKREVRMPNVLFLGWRLNKVEDLLRSVATT